METKLLFTPRIKIYAFLLIILLPILSYSQQIGVTGNGNSISDGDNTPTTTDFTDFGSTTSRTFYVDNIQTSGNTTLSVTSISVSGSDFTISSGLPDSTISKNQSPEPFTVSFIGTGCGTFTATVTIVSSNASNDGADNAWTFTISKSILAEMDIVDSGGNAISDGSIDSPSITNTTDYGNVNVSSGFVTTVYTIENNGDCDLTLSGFSNTNTTDFTLDTSSTATTISSGGSTTFTVTFDPTTTTTTQSIITIDNDDSDENPYTFTVQGTGFNIASLCGTTITTFPYTEDFETDFGAWTQDTSDDFDWTRNTGTTPTADTGPSGAHSGSYYVYAEATGNTNSTANLIGPCFDLSSTTNPRFTLFYHMFGANILVDTNGSGPEDDQIDVTNSTNYMGDFAIDLSTDGGITYPVSLFANSEYVQVDESSAYIALSFDLNAYTGQFVKIRLQSTTGSDSRSDIAVDYITLTGRNEPTTAPGGVTTDLATWLKANDGLSYSDGQSVSLWSDQGRGSNVRALNSGQEPTFYDNSSRNVNFNPVVEFDNPYSVYDTDLYYTNNYTTNSQFLAGDYGFHTQELFIVLIPDDTPISSSFGFMDIYCADSNLAKAETDATGLGAGFYTGRIDNEVFAYAHSTYSTNESGDGFAVYQQGSESYTNVGILNTRNNDNSPSAADDQELFYNANDIKDAPTNDPAEFLNTSDTRFFIGRSEGWESSLNARVVEVISYSARKDDTDLTQERNKIQSYLAVKYGITLGVNGTSQDYVDSDGAVIWDQSGNVGYNYDIAGIGRDNVSELHQKQSKSVNDSNDITIGLTDIYSTNNENISTNSVNTFNNKEFLMWGNDNLGTAARPSPVVVDMSEGITPLDLTDLNTVVDFTAISQTWKVIEKGTVGMAKVALPETMLTSTIPLPDPGGVYLMFISSTPVFDPSAEYRIMASDGSGNLETTYNFPTNDVKYITFGYAPERTFTRSIYFDGAVDYLDAGDVLDLNPTEFTISAWIKRGTSSADKSIMSKRDAAYSNGGYDFKITSTGKVEMSWKNGGTRTITSVTTIPTNIWHQVAVIYDGTNASLYIDGVLDNTTPLGAPITPVSNSESFLIAAADGEEINTTAFFEGNIDEVRLWDKALTEDELHFVMNQEIEDNTNVSGSYFELKSITPTKNDIASVPWSNLKGYYPMSTYTFTNCKDASGNGNTAALKNLNTVDYQTAPLPYISVAGVSTDWDTSTTWINGNVQTIPGAKSIIAPTVDRDGDSDVDEDDRYTVDWNIVQIGSNVTLNNTALSGANNGNRNVLGLIVDDTFKLTAEGTTTLSTDSNSAGTGNGLTVTHYLGLDGKIDLEGESQLIQTTDSDLVVGTNGELERDQQGIGNVYRYNDWSSPVQQWYDGSAYSIPVDGTYNIAGVLRDGTTPSSPQEITFVGGYDGSVGSPIEIANYWLYVRNDNPDTGDIDSNWRRVGSQGIVNLGEGFLMKGTGSGTDQNYVFQGKPNNGDITVPVVNDNDFLVGNPYPSAIDADLFIADNAGAILGTIYFWDHFGGSSHNLKDYEAGHATYTYMGGVAAASNLAVHTSNPSASGSKVPGRFIPVGQAFYIEGDGAGNKSVIFKNSQRVFVEEDGGTSSVFMKPGKTTSSKVANVDQISQVLADVRPKFRIGFNTPNGGHRQLLLGMDERASEGVDYGFDGLIYGMNDDDMYWEIEGQKYVIQGTNQYSLDSEFPIGLTVKTAGEISIEVDAIENVAENTKLYIKDNSSGETHDISSSPFETTLEEGVYSNRFSLVFEAQNTLGVEGEILRNGIQVFMDNSAKELQIRKSIDQEIETVILYNSLGQTSEYWKQDFLGESFSLPVKVGQGVYIVQIITFDGMISKKIVIE